MAKKKVTIVTKKKKSTGASASASKKATASEAKAGTKKVAPKKSGPLGLPSIPEILDFPAGLAENAREVWMAGIGALSTVEELGAGLFQQLVNKGEHWEQESREKLTAATKQAGAAVEGARSTAESLRQKPLAWTSAVEAQVERMVEDSIEGVLHRMNVPTHDEVQDLIGRVTALSAKVDALSARLKLQKADRAPSTSAATPARAASASAASADAADAFHVVPHDEGWAVEKEGASRASSVHGTKAEAVTAGRERARAGASGRLVIHRQDGTIQDSFSYGE
jgi:poly(hydroxyalkanoate) granule-associated protein